MSNKTTNIGELNTVALNIESASVRDDVESVVESGAGVWRFDSADDIVQTDAFYDPYDAAAWESLFERTLEAGGTEKGNSGIDNVTGELPVPTLKIHHTVK